MQTDNITLNGKDWSNLYIVDYPGGAGGELFCEELAKSNNFLRFRNKEDTDTVTDSTYNTLATDGLPDYTDILYTIRNIEDLSNIDNLKKLIKSSLIISDIIHKTNSNWRGTLSDSLPGGIINNFIKFSGVDINQIAKGILLKEIKENVIIRTHLNLSIYDELENCNIIRIRPRSEEHNNLINFRIGILKWLSKTTSNKFGWEKESKYKGLKIDTFEDFVNVNWGKWDGITYDNQIDAFDWLTQIDKSDSNIIMQWKQKNVKMFEDYNIDINNPPNEHILKHILIKKYKNVYN